MGPAVRPAAEAWRLLDLLFSDARFTFAGEPPGLETAVRRWTADRQAATKVWTDAYLAAFAQAAGVSLVTFDRGFRRYEGLNVVLLEQN